jgi:hypothetical protein
MNEDNRSTPEELKGFVPRPASPHLRAKVLAAAAATPPAGRFLTAAQWGMAAACALLVIGALAGDAVLSKALAERLDVLLNERSAASPVANADRTGLEEILGADQVRLLGTKTTRPRRDSTIRIDGRMEGRGSNLEDKEDADVPTKNPR